LQTYRREFLRQSEHRLHADYDRGFFSAWADYMRILPKLDSLTTVSIPNKNRIEKEAEETEPQPEIKKEEGEEARDEEREEVKGEMKTEAEKAEQEKVEETKIVERIEPRQSTLFDFSK